MAAPTSRTNVVGKRLEGKVSVITGGDEGIGRAIALRLAADGTDIAFCYRTNRKGVEEVVNAIKGDGANAGTGREALAVRADVSNITQTRNFITAVFEYFGKVDILVNNAGLERRAPFWEVSEEDYELVLNVNLKGTFFTTQAVVQQWIAARRRGKIIDISSVHEELPFPHFATYSASKGGLEDADA